MSYDEVEIEDMKWDDALQAYTYPCPCGDLFQITVEELRAGEEIARCPSCSLFITVVYDADKFADATPPGGGAAASVAATPPAAAVTVHS